MITLVSQLSRFFEFGVPFSAPLFLFFVGSISIAVKKKMTVCQTFFLVCAIALFVLIYAYGFRREFAYIFSIALMIGATQKLLELDSKYSSTAISSLAIFVGFALYFSFIVDVFSFAEPSYYSVYISITLLYASSFLKPTRIRKSLYALVCLFSIFQMVNYSNAAAIYPVGLVVFYALFAGFLDNKTFVFSTGSVILLLWASLVLISPHGIQTEYASEFWRFFMTRYYILSLFQDVSIQAGSYRFEKISAYLLDTLYPQSWLTVLIYSFGRFGLVAGVLVILYACRFALSERGSWGFRRYVIFSHGFFSFLIQGSVWDPLFYLFLFQIIPRKRRLPHIADRS